MRYYVSQHGELEQRLDRPGKRHAPVSPVSQIWLAWRGLLTTTTLVLD